MNRLIRQSLWAVPPCVMLLSGCFGGKVQAPRPEALVRAETTLSRGLRAEQKGDSLEAERLLIQSLTLSTSIEDDPARAAALINLARLYRLQQELPKAESFIDQALAIVAVAPHVSAEAIYEKALVELATGRSSTALEWAQKAIAAEHGSARGSRLNLAARIHLVQGNWREADAFAGKALNESRSAGQAEEEANSLRTLGIVARHGKNYDRGAQLLREALQIDKRIGKNGKIATDLGELAVTARSAGRLSESAALFERACVVNRAGGRLRQAQENQEALADVYSGLGEEHKAARARESARKLAVQDATVKPGSPSATINPSSRP